MEAIIMSVRVEQQGFVSTVIIDRNRITCAGDEPCVYFLTVSPHRAPTHTNYDAQGNRKPTTPGAVRPTDLPAPLRGRKRGRKAARTRKPAWSATRRAVSERMKRYWAARRAGRKK